jgi:hypothetical protein
VLSTHLQRTKRSGAEQGPRAHHPASGRKRLGLSSLLYIRRREWKARTVYSLGSGHVPTDRTASAGGPVTPTGECTRAPPRYTACSSSPFHRNSDGHPDQINLRLAGRIAKTRPRFCLTVCSPLHLLSSSGLPNLFFSFLFRNKLRLFL